MDLMSPIVAIEDLLRINCVRCNYLSEQYMDDMSPSKFGSETRFYSTNRSN